MCNVQVTSKITKRKAWATFVLFSTAKAQMEQDANAGYLISWPRHEQEQDLIQVRYRSESRRDGGAAFPA